MTSQNPFLWGAATSSHQIEGNNIHSDWWAWEKEGRIEGGVSSGAATDHWNRFAEDLKLASSLGLNSYRFSIEWSRIEPKEGTWDETALDWYDNLISECEKQNLIPMLTLHHFTSPKWFADQGGFSNPESPRYFTRFVSKILSRLGPRVPLWCTFNEPMVLVIGTYLGKFMPPAEFSPKKASQALANLLKSHALSYDLIHQSIRTRSGPFAKLPLQVGIAQNMLKFRPHRAWHPGDLLCAYLFDRFYNVSFLDAVMGKKQKFGLLPLIPSPAKVKEAFGRKTSEFIGINYYTNAYIECMPKSPAADCPPDLPIGITFARMGEGVSDLDWALYPEGLGILLNRVSKYGVPIYITENGIADAEDSKRGEYLQSHLAQIEAAMERGVEILGYYHWSLLDNFEWIKGYGPRFGLFEVNYGSQERTRRKSADWYAARIAHYRTQNPAGVPVKDK